MLKRRVPIEVLYLAILVRLLEQLSIWVQISSQSVHVLLASLDANRKFFLIAQVHHDWFLKILLKLSGIRIHRIPTEFILHRSIGQLVFKLQNLVFKVLR